MQRPSSDSMPARRQARVQEWASVRLTPTLPAVSHSPRSSPCARQVGGRAAMQTLYAWQSCMQLSCMRPCMHGMRLRSQCTAASAGGARRAPAALQEPPRALAARWVVTSEEEQAVSTVMAGPFRPNV